MGKKTDSDTRHTLDILNSQYGKLPPQAIEVEEAVLGAIMLERDAIYKVSPIITADAFYKEEHKKIFKTVEKLAAASQQIDLLTVTQKLKDEKKLDEVGGPGYITQLTRRVVSAAHIEQHSKTIKFTHVLREIIWRSSELINTAYGGDIDETEIKYAMHTQAIDSLMAGNSGMMHIRDILIKTNSHLEEIQKRISDGVTPGISTGLTDLNNFLHGWMDTDLIVIAARPGMGKTAIALFFTKVAALLGKNVCVFSLEMENIKLSTRLILSWGGIERSVFQNRKMTEGDWEAYHRSVAELEQLPIYIDDTPGVDTRYIDAVVRNKTRKGECDLVVIDYLQLMESKAEGYYNKNREREVAEMSRALKKTAKAANVPVILLAQLNRGVENRVDKIPHLADLRESGAIEQDADIVMFPVRPEVYGITEDDKGESLIGITFLEIAKHREGDTGRIYIKHKKDLTQYYDLDSIDFQEPVGEGANWYETEK